MACTYYSFKGGFFGGDYWCDKKDCRVDEDTYYKYCKNYNYDECEIYKQSNSSGCFITTIICHTLGKQDDDRILQTLRSFRDNILQKDEKYYDILKEYDTIGPIIADCIANDQYKEIVAEETYQKSIIPIYYLIYHKKYDEAITRYQLMTQLLIDYYSLNEEYAKIKSQNYNYEDFTPETAGHGKRRAKSIEINQSL